MKDQYAVGPLAVDPLFYTRSGLDGERSTLIQMREGSQARGLGFNPVVLELCISLGRSIGGLVIVA